MAPLTRLWCAIRGHEEYLHFEKNRVYLECVACGHESPGWTIEAPRPVVRFAARRSTTTSLDLARKIA